VKKIHSIALPGMLSALLLLACQEPPTSPVAAPTSYQLAISTSAASSGNPRATGGGTTVELGEKSTFTFNAIQHNDGTVNGHLVYNLRGSDISIKMDIDCLNIIGNQATLSGTVTQVTGTAPSFIFEGQKAVFKVEDNGEGGAAPPDLISDLFLFAGATCNVPFPVPYLPIDGNIQVSG
jgi:hypothetical protein